MTRKSRRKNYVEETMVRTLDKLSKFAEFVDLLPKLQSMIKKGKSAEEIRDWAAPMVQASITNIALTDKDTKTRLAAGKDVMDRKDGKAKETKEIKHRMDKLTDIQLEALLKSELEEYDSGSKKTH